MEIVVSGNQLTADGQTFPCAIGRNGYTQSKREGDGCTPIGTFSVREVFYRADRIGAPVTKLPSRSITSADGWCDAPDDEKYNHHVYLPYPASHEELWHEDHLYDLIVVIGYNDEPVVPGAGSAIFMHVAAANFSGTQGCVALELSVLQGLLKQMSHETVIVFRGA